jgi:hypothetical protein
MKKFREMAASFVLCNEDITKALELLDNSSGTIPDEVTLWEKFQYDPIENIIDHIDTLEGMLNLAYQEGRKNSMNTTENNKLIAEFMRWNIKSPTTIPTNLHLSNIELDNGEVMELQFQESWDWLMPVVEEIEKLGFVFKMYGNVTTFLKKRTFNEPIWNDDFTGKTKIESVYNACVEFIEWNNEKK